MKNPKRPTLAQKLAMKACGLTPENWLVSKANGDFLHCVHRLTGRTKDIPKN